jgi:hypothetical protein
LVSLATTVPRPRQRDLVEVAGQVQVGRELDRRARMVMCIREHPSNSVCRYISYWLEAPRVRESGAGPEGGDVGRDGA